MLNNEINLSMNSITFKLLASFYKRLVSCNVLCCSRSAVLCIPWDRPVYIFDLLNPEQLCYIHFSSPLCVLPRKGIRSISLCQYYQIIIFFFFFFLSLLFCKLSV